MGCTREEFLGWLRAACPGLVAGSDTDRFTLAIGNGELDVTVREAPARRIGAVSIPVLNVTFRFAGVGRADRDAFLAAFDLRTRRGGG